MYTLKNMAIKKGLVSEKAASDLSQTFIGNVDKNGRSFELGLASRQFLKHWHMSVTSMASMGLGLMSKGRMDLTPEKIDGIFQLRSILMRAKELEAENE
jgi:heterodisulfide reductase subunit C/quinone-modifying oxidoreductase subunit QmoC